MNQLGDRPGPGIPDRPVGKVLKTWPEFAAGLEFGRWFRAKVSVIGDKGQCHLDDKRTQSFRADRYPKGSVGLWTNRSQYRFRNIKVTSADGKAVLLEGVPDLQVAR